jgi:hypothetical protein
MLHRIADGILLCKLDQTNEDHKGNWYQLAQKFRSETAGECGIFQMYEEFDTDDARGTLKVQFRISIAKAAFNKKLDLNWRKRLFKCYIWIIVLYGTETWTLQKVYHKYLESCEIWC